MGTGDARGTGTSPLPAPRDKEPDVPPGADTPPPSQEFTGAGSDPQPGVPSGPAAPARPSPGSPRPGPVPSGARSSPGRCLAVPCRAVPGRSGAGTGRAGAGEARRDGTGRDGAGPAPGAAWGSPRAGTGTGSTGMLSPTGAHGPGGARRVAGHPWGTSLCGHGAPEGRR